MEGTGRPTRPSPAPSLFSFPSTPFARPSLSPSPSSTPTFARDSTATVGNGDGGDVQARSQPSSSAESGTTAAPPAGAAADAGAGAAGGDGGKAGEGGGQLEPLPLTRKVWRQVAWLLSRQRGRLDPLRVGVHFMCCCCGSRFARVCLWQALDRVIGAARQQPCGAR